MRIDALPNWLVFLATVAVVAVAVEVGYRFGHRRRRRSEEEKESPVGAIAGAILGLAAFLLAFTFSIVADRHAARRGLVRDEAAAIRNAWQRSDLLPDALRFEAVGLFQDYLTRRIEFAEEANFEAQHTRDVLARADGQLKRLWEIGVAGSRTGMNSDYASLYLSAVNDVARLHAQRVAIAIQAHIPPEIWLVLYCVTVLGMVAVGYQTGIAGSKRSMSWTILSVAFAVVFALIASLDHSDSGVLRVTQRPLIDLQRSMTGGGS